MTSLDAVRADVREALSDLESLFADRAPVRHSVVVDAMYHLWCLTGLFLYGSALDRAATRLQRVSGDVRLLQEPVRRVSLDDLPIDRNAMERNGLEVSTQTYYAARRRRTHQEPKPQRRDIAPERWRRIERISDLGDL